MLSGDEPHGLFTGAFPIMARVTDITHYGAGVVSMLPLAVGERVVVKMHPPRANARELSLAAESVHCGSASSGYGFDEAKIGLQFLGPGERIRGELEAMLRGLGHRTGASRPDYERLRLAAR